MFGFHGLSVRLLDDTEHLYLLVRFPDTIASGSFPTLIYPWRISVVLIPTGFSRDSSGALLLAFTLAAVGRLFSHISFMSSHRLFAVDASPR